MGETEEISVVSLRPERAGGSLSVTEGPKVTTEEDRVEAGPTKASDIISFRKTGYIPGRPVFRTLTEILSHEQDCRAGDGVGRL